MNEIVEKFNETYPDITVTIEPGNGGAYSEFIKTKDSVGEFPDVMEMRDTAMYVRAHWSFRNIWYVECYFDNIFTTTYFVRECKSFLRLEDVINIDEPRSFVYN